MLRDSLWRVYQKVILLQAGSGVFLALVALLAAGMSAGASALVGAFGALLGSIAYAWMARPNRVVAKPAGRIAWRHFHAEAAKIIVMVVYLFVAMSLVGSVAWLSALWLLAGFAVVVMAQAFAFLVIR